MTCCDIDLTPMWDSEGRISLLFAGHEETSLFGLALTKEEARVFGELLLLASKCESDGSCFGMRTVGIEPANCHEVLKPVLERIDAS